MILHNLKRSSWHLIASVTVFALTEFCLPGQPSAQTLNDAVDSLLADDCAKLNPIRDTFGGGTSPQYFGNELNALCRSAGFVNAITTRGWRCVASRICFVDFEQSVAPTVG